jgi:hypothetical protein
MMKRYSRPGFILLLSAMFLLTSISLSLVPHSARAQDSKPTPGVKAPTPQEGSAAIPTPKKPEIVDNSDKVKPAVTFDDLLAKYPALEAYLEKLDEIESDEYYKEIDYNELYQQLVMIYKGSGATGVSVFLEESYLSEDLDIPLELFDLIVRFEDGGFDKIVEQAKTSDLIEDDEIVSYLAIYPAEEVEATKAELKKVGISAYDFDDDDEVLEIGIPLKVLSDLKTPDAMLKFLATVGNMDNVDEFFAPETELETAK